MDWNQTTLDVIDNLDNTGRRKEALTEDDHRFHCRTLLSQTQIARYKKNSFSGLRKLRSASAIDRVPSGSVTVASKNHDKQILAEREISVSARTRLEG